MFIYCARMKNICILGSTGSIGRSSLEVIAAFPERFRVTCLTANKNVELLRRQVEQFHPQAVAITDESSASTFRSSMNGSLNVFSGADGLQEVMRCVETDVVISSMVGIAGLKPTLEAIRRGRTVALANKEALVVAGEIMMREVNAHGATLIPIDSEHSAIMQCLAGERPEDIARLILTASGGPFLHLGKEKFPHITVEEALKHPNWKMGNKVTIDSATLMNKGLEVIEAHWLFGLPVEKIDVLIHPQSIIHSMVEFVDGSVKAQLGAPDMKLPIQYALTYPGRVSSKIQRIDFSQLGQMTFFEPDRRKFECLQLAREALRRGGTGPAILNAANEVAVERFLGRSITFDSIPRIIRETMERIPAAQHPALDDIIETDRLSRLAAQEIAARLN